MTPRGFRFAMGEASTMLQPPPAELYRNGHDLHRRSLDLNVHAFDFSDFGFLQAHRASAFFDACAFAPVCSSSSSIPYYHHLPFAPPPPASDFWHQQVRDYWSRSLPSWQELFYNFAKQEASPNLPKQQSRSFKKQDQAPIVSAEVHTSTAPDKSDNLLPLSSDASPKPSQDLYAKYVIESPTWLPLGWITEVQTRRTGTTAGTRDKYYKDPVSGRRFRSRNEVFHFLETGKGRVRRRYKGRIMNSESTTDTACVMTKVPIPSAVNAHITETECQRLSSPAYSRTLELHSVNKDTSFKSLSVPFTIPPGKEKLPQEWPRPSTFAGSPAPETSADCLPPKGLKTCLKPPTISRKRCSQDRPQKAPVKKKVRFESPRKGVERQDSKLWQWLQKPVGLQGATQNEHQEKNLEQRPEVMEATMVSKIERPKEAGSVVEVGNKQQAGVKCGLLRKNVRVAMDDELSILIRQPGLTSRQRARLVQKFKARRVKQLLAILGRKICCQLLGLPAR